jgi:hypothetical protein
VNPVVDEVPLVPAGLVAVTSSVPVPEGAVTLAVVPVLDTTVAVVAGEGVNGECK